MVLNEVLAEVVFVALPVDTAALPRQVAAGTGQHMYLRVPRASILDVVSLLSTWNFPYPLCPQLVNRNFDRYRARLMYITVGNEPDAGRYSVQRKVALTTPGGWKILQHTRTSKEDFFLGPRTPFRLP